MQYTKNIVLRHAARCRLLVIMLSGVMFLSSQIVQVNIIIFYVFQNMRIYIWQLGASACTRDLMVLYLCGLKRYLVSCRPYV